MELTYNYKSLLAVAGVKYHKNKILRFFCMRMNISQSIWFVYSIEHRFSITIHIEN
jgi:hypothetical protein